MKWNEKLFNEIDYKEIENVMEADEDFYADHFYDEVERGDWYGSGSFMFIPSDSLLLETLYFYYKVGSKQELAEKLGGTFVSDADDSCYTLIDKFDSVDHNWNGIYILVGDNTDIIDIYLFDGNGDGKKKKAFMNWLNEK